MCKDTKSEFYPNKILECVLWAVGKVYTLEPMRI